MRIRSINRILNSVAFAVLVSLSAAPSLAADPSERPYNPPVGSRWIIAAETSAVETTAVGQRTTLLTTRSELSIDEKTTEGFRVSYVQRNATAEGNNPMVAMLRSSVKSLENVTIRATTNASGKPIRVDNLDEAKAAMRSMMSNMLQKYQDQPKLLLLLNQISAGITEVDAEHAAASYLDALSLLAKAQNTGMSVGEIRHSSDATSNPLGAGLIANSTFEMTGLDAAAGTASYAATTNFDSASLKRSTQATIDRMMAAVGPDANREQIENLLKSMTLSIDERAVFEVEDGMTRKLSKTSEARGSNMGHSFTKTETMTVKVTPAP
jgi:hypothetical protein